MFIIYALAGVLEQLHTVIRQHCMTKDSVQSHWADENSHFAPQSKVIGNQKSKCESEDGQYGQYFLI